MSNNTGWQRLPMDPNAPEFDFSQLIEDSLGTAEGDDVATDSLTEESTQNVPDASLDGKTPIIHYKIIENGGEELEGLDIFDDEFVELQRETNQFFDKRTDLLNKNILVIEDYNTTGLIGDFTEDETDFHGLFKKFGKSGKDNRKKTLGSRGIGIRSAILRNTDLKSFFAYSKREHDDTEVMGGIYLANQPRNTEHPFYYFLTEEEESGTRKAITDKNLLSSFKESFGLRIINESLKDTSGTAILIPSIKSSNTAKDYAINAIKHVYMQIKDGNFIVAYTHEGETVFVDKTNIEEKLEEYNCIQQKTFLEKFYQDTLNLDFDNDSDFFVFDDKTLRDAKVTKDDFERCELNLEQISKKFNSFEVISFKIKIKIELKDNSTKFSYITAHYKKPRNKDEKGLKIIARNGRPLRSEPNTPILQNTYALLKIDDDGISDMVKTMEPAQHDKIKTNPLTTSFKIKYKEAPGKRLLSGVRNCLRQIIELITEDTSQEEDTKALANIFPIVSDDYQDEDDIKNPNDDKKDGEDETEDSDEKNVNDEDDDGDQETTETEEEEKDIEKKQRKFKVRFTKDNSLIISKNNNYKWLPTNTNFKIKVKINWTQKSKKYLYNDLDFDLKEKDSDKKIIKKNIKNFNINKNVISFETDLTSLADKKSNFELTVKDFNPSIKWEVDVREDK